MNECINCNNFTLYYSISWRILSHNVWNMPIMNRLRYLFRNTKNPFVTNESDGIECRCCKLSVENKNINCNRRLKHTTLSQSTRQFILLRYTHKVVCEFCLLLLFFFLAERQNKLQQHESDIQNVNKRMSINQRKSKEWRTNRGRLTISDNYEYNIKITQCYKRSIKNHTERKIIKRIAEIVRSMFNYSFLFFSFLPSHVVVYLAKHL